MIDRVLDPFANDVQLALELVAGIAAGEAGAAADEDLREPGFDRHGARSDESVVSRHVAPPDQRLPFFGDDPIEQRGDHRAGVGVVRQEHQADAILASRRERGRCNLAQEPVRYLGHDAGPVAGVFLAPAGAAVRKVDQDLKGLLHDARATGGLSCRR